MSVLTRLVPRVAAGASIRALKTELVWVLTREISIGKLRPVKQEIMDWLHTAPAAKLVASDAGISHDEMLDRLDEACAFSSIVNTLVKRNPASFR